LINKKIVHSKKEGKLMNIRVQDKVLEFKNDPEIIEQLFESINDLIQKDNLLFSHLIIDGEEIYNNFDKYIIENIESIKTIEVIVISIAEMVKESIASTKQYAENAIPIINKLAEEFYQKPNENTWPQLTDLFEGIQWIIQSITQINLIESANDIVRDYNIWDEYVQEVSKLNDIIPELENVIVNKDNILIGDILLFEVVPVFETIIGKLSLLVSEAVD
jgi:hypothetical protein